jgi:hypothetical protein
MRIIGCEIVTLRTQVRLQTAGFLTAGEELVCDPSALVEVAGREAGAAGRVRVEMAGGMAPGART